MSAALLFWFLLLAASMLKLGTHDSGIMLDDARGRFSGLAAYLVCLGAPVGLALGIRGGMLPDSSRPRFNRSRAIVAGGLAGVISGLIFGHWMWQGGFFPLIAGLGGIPSQAIRVILQFCVAFMIGATFGLLFQRDVRGYGSCMGWGLGYTVCWWFAGPTHALSSRPADAIELVDGCGDAVVRSAGGLHPLRTHPGRGLCNV